MCARSLSLGRSRVRVGMMVGRMFIKGTPLPKSQSWLHLAYVLVELAKVLALALSPFLVAPFSGLLGL